MEAGIYCLVDAGGKLYLKDGAESHSDIAATFGLDEDACQRYRFDLTDRRLLGDHSQPAIDEAVRLHLDRYVGNAERLMKFAEEGHLPKRLLASLLEPARRQVYLDACAIIEKRFTEECTAKNDPCLESGCSVEGEVCLQPLLRAEVDYHKACAAEWTKLFANPRSRIEAWNK